MADGIICCSSLLGAEEQCNTRGRSNPMPQQVGKQLYIFNDGDVAYSFVNNNNTM